MKELDPGARNTRWYRYAFCETCGARTGEPCQHKGKVKKPIALFYPHPGRQILARYKWRQGDYK